MTRNQAKGLKVGQRVTHIYYNKIIGTTINMGDGYVKQIIGPFVFIEWMGMGLSRYHITRMNSIHVMAN